MRIVLILFMLLIQISSLYVLKYKTNESLSRIWNSNHLENQATELDVPAILNNESETAVEAPKPGLVNSPGLDEMPLSVFSVDDDIFFEDQITEEPGTDYTNYTNTKNYHTPRKSQVNDNNLERIAGVFTERVVISSGFTTVDPLVLTTIKYETISDTRRYNVSFGAPGYKTTSSTESTTVERPTTLNYPSSPSHDIIDKTAAYPDNTINKPKICDYPEHSHNDECSVNIDISEDNGKQEDDKSLDDFEILEGSGNIPNFGHIPNMSNEVEGSAKIELSGDTNSSKIESFVEPRSSGDTESSKGSESSGDSSGSGDAEISGEIFEKNPNFEATVGSGDSNIFGDTEISEECEYSGDTQGSGHTQISGDTESSEESEQSGDTEGSGDTKYSGDSEKSKEIESSSDTENSGHVEGSTASGDSGDLEDDDAEYSGDTEHYAGAIYKTVHPTEYEVFGENEILTTSPNEDLYFAQ